MQVFQTSSLHGVPKGHKIEPYPGSDEDMRQEHFRINCLGYSLDSLSYCGHGTGMTVDEMNSNLRRKGRSEIVIPYCKYCYQEKTPGFFDDNPTYMGLRFWFPEEHPSKRFVLERMTPQQIDKLNRS